MRRTLRPLAALAVVALISVTSAGCSSASAGADTGVGGNNTLTSEVSTATLRPAGTGSSTGNNTAATAPAQAGNGGGSSNAAATRQQAVKFAECMRANGVKQFPDPDASGKLTIDAIANGSSLDTNSAAFKRALSACKDLEPPGFTGGKRSPEQQQAALKFAQCVRDNGVPDFPDPAPDGPLIDTNRIPSSNSAAGRSALHAAMHTCSAFAAAAGVPGGQ